MFFRKPKEIVGLDIGSSAVKVVQLRGSEAEGYSLAKFGVIPLAPEMIVDGAVMDAGRVIEAIQTLFKEQDIRTKQVVISVSGHSVIVKKITLPEMTEEELTESIKWEAEQYIPFDINDVNMDFQILNTVPGAEGRPQMNVILVAVKKDKLNDYFSLAVEAGLDPAIVDVDAFALENMYGANYDVVEGEATALVNIGASVTNINILLSGTFAFTRDISIGGNRYTEAVQKDLGISHEEAERAKMGGMEGVDEEALSGILEGVSKEIASEILRSFGYFRTTANHDRIDRVLLSGGSAKMPNFIPFLQERLEIPVEMADPFRKITFDPAQFDPDYLRESGPMAAVAMGLGTRRLGDR